MNIRDKLVRFLSIVIFSVGLLLGMALFGIVVWADFEAILFDPAIRQDASLNSLRCPVMMTEVETGTVSAAFTNSLDRSVELFVRAHISDGYVTLMKEVDTRLPLAAGETQRLQWTVFPDDAAFGRLILVKVIVKGGYPLPSRQGTCGILVVNAPYLTGGQIFTLGLAVGFLSMLIGAGLWILVERPLNETGLQVARAMGMLAGAVLVGTIFGLLGWWLPGAALFMVTLLAIGAIIGYFLNRIGKETV